MRISALSFVVAAPLLGLTTARSAFADTYVYDGANRLASATVANATVTYKFDGLGSVVSRCTASGCAAVVTDDAAEHARVVGDSLDATSNLYAYGPSGLAASRAALITYPLADSLGSIRGAAVASGELRSRRSYDGFGNVRSDVGLPPAIGFAGELTGPEDHVVWLRARSMSNGRFLQRDTFGGVSGRPQSLNRYAYAEGNPTNYTDPSGHFVPFVAAALVGTMLGGLVLPFTVPAGRWYAEQSLDPCLRDRLRNDADYRRSFYDDSEDAIALGNGLVSTAGALAGGFARPPAGLGTAPPRRPRGRGPKPPGFPETAPGAAPRGNRPPALSQNNESYGPDGQPTLKTFPPVPSTVLSPESLAGLEPGNYIYVTNPNGVTRVIPNAAGGHSNVLGGAAETQFAASAGHLRIGPNANGQNRVLEMNGASGHFQPTEAQVDWAASRLRDQGVDVGRVRRGY